MKILPILLLALTLSGCSTLSSIKVPPGSLTSWHHLGNFGPWQSNVSVTDVTKLTDGTFILGHYDGSAGWLGFGEHDIIDGLHIDGSGVPVSK
jgi:hypothetical protein